MIDRGPGDQYLFVVCTTSKKLNPTSDVIQQGGHSAVCISVRAMRNDVRREVKDSVGLPSLACVVVFLSVLDRVAVSSG